VILAIGLVLACVAAAALVLAGVSVRVLREYERGVVFRLGRVTSQRGPGMIFLLPGIDRMVRVSLRTVTLEIPAQEIITRDSGLDGAERARLDEALAGAREALAQTTSDPALVTSLQRGV
jgi:regulator of protease activity HflC (stomatin/prohibitin superfamily)